jgi:transcriptional regulator with XRE-family HTH domain
MIIIMETLRDLVCKNFNRMLEQHLKDNPGLTISRFAKDLKFSEPTFYRWKNGESVPEVANMEILARAFRVDPMEFYRQEGGPAVVNISPSRALKKYLVIPDSIVEELCHYDSTHEVWDLIQGVIDGVKKAEEQLKGS